MSNILAYAQNVVTTHLTTLLLAIGVLVGGWLIALIAAAIVRRGLRRTSLDNRLAAWLVGEEKEQKLDIERWAGRVVFWILMLFVFVGFFQVIGLTAVTQPLNSFLNRIFDYLPRLLAPVLLGFAAWILATALRFVVRRVLDALGIDERLGEQAGLDEAERVPLARTLSETVYWLVFLVFLPAILSSLDLQGLLEPVQGMVDEVLAFLPNLFAAALILAAGWLVARIVQRIVSNLLAAVGADSLSEQVGLDRALGEQRLSGLVGLVLYVLILIPVLIAALNTLKLEAITRPASAMLQTILSTLPLLFGASLVLLVAYLVGRVVSGLVSNLLAGVGFDGILERLGIGREPAEDERTPSAIVGTLVLIAIMLFATVEAVRLLGFLVLAELVTDFMVFAGHVLLGVIVFGVGLFLANLAAQTINTGRTGQGRTLAAAARISITVLAAAMALRQMGLANEIITLAFGLLLGAIAVAAALAFGLGCRDMAAETARGWLARVTTTNGQQD